MALTGNKGEWSEVYALFKLLSEKEVYSGDSNLNKIEDLFYPIIKIIRNEALEIEGSKNKTEKKKEYAIASGDIVIVTEDGKEELRIPISEFSKQAEYLFNQIKAQSGSFPVPLTEEFMESVYCEKIKAKSTDKTDIKIVIHDLRTGMSPTLGFSIKSQLGKASTLLNASQTTNFIYQIENVILTEEQRNEINNIKSKSKIRERVLAIKKLGGTLKYLGIESSVFQNNLIMIDACLPQIISEMILMYYSGEGGLINDLVERLHDSNPIGFDMSLSHKFYEYKIKHLLTDAALGMMPGLVWSGVYDANGGYLVVKEDGDVLCYHFYNKYDFEAYLLNNTKFETASSSRHGFGTIYEEQKLKLNLQIRFK